MQLFALLTDVKHSGAAEGSRKVGEFLSFQFNTDYVTKYVHLYESYVARYHTAALADSGADEVALQVQTARNFDRLRAICESINMEIDTREKVLLLSSMLGYIARPDYTEEEEQFVDRLADCLRIPAQDYWNLKTFTIREPMMVVQKQRLLYISNTPEKKNADTKHIYARDFGVELWVLHVACTNSFFFRYSGDRNLYLSGHKMDAGKVYPIEPGAVLGTSHVRPVYFGHIAEKFISREERGRILYHAKDIEYKFSDDIVGVHEFSFEGKSGQLVGIMGGSGSGKSTLMNLMCGRLKPTHGSIVINGYDLNNEPEKFEGVIGYVPQDDMLSEELTVEQNLWFNAQLIFRGKSREEKAVLVEKALADFDLTEARDLRVGSPVNKIISGGQRKRLNIALELMREPSILFADEPTSGLSSSDSEKVMTLLKRQVLKGKLVIINIHQPSSDIYKLLDRLILIDQGGYVVYNGNPMNAIVYFKQKAHYVNAEERECYKCGNVKTEQPLRIIETRMVDPSGKLIRRRKVTPQEWYKSYKDEIESKFDWKSRKNVQREKLPNNLCQIPSRRSQIWTYICRDGLKKLHNTQYVILNLIEVPILALLLAFATRYIGESGIYSLAANDNIPTYLFMCVVVALFMGLNISAEEIIRDKQLLMRESFLGLSRTAYLGAKIMNLLFISLVQTMMLVSIGHGILGIDGMWLAHTGILFTAYAWAVLLGLNISSGLKSQVAIYITIPLVLVPQLLFSGTMVDYSKLHPMIGHREYVPAIGDMMTSRWAYEAMAVEQYRNNAYERNFNAVEEERSLASYVLNSWLPEIEQAERSGRTALAESEARKVAEELGVSLSRSEKAVGAVGKLKAEAQARYNKATEERDKISVEMAERLGGVEALARLKHESTNDALTSLVTRRDQYTYISVYDDKMVRRRQPIYQEPTSEWGRAQLYAPVKKIFGMKVETPLFNCCVMWLSVFLLYVTLYFDLLRKALDYIDGIRKRQLNRRIEKLRSR